MKRYILISSLFISAFLSLSLFPSCTSSQANNALNPREIPDLLARNEGLGSPEERQKTLNVYAGLKKSLMQDHLDIDSRLKLVQLFMLEARVSGEHGYYYPAALNQLETILSFFPKQEDRFYALSLKSGILLSLHKFSEAKLVAEEAREINPHNAQIYGALVDSYVELGQYAKAVEKADKMVSIRPDLRSYARVSYLREIHGEVTAAIEAMQMAVDAAYPGYEESAWCRLTLGNLYENYGQLSAAKHEYKQILQERKDYPFAIAALGNIALKEKKYEEARELLESACSFIPEVSFYESLITVYKKMGLEKKSSETLEAVWEMLADDTEKGHNMSLEYAHLYLHEVGDYEKALTYVLEEARSRPDNIDINLMLAAIYYKMNKLSLALLHIDKAGITKSKNPEYLMVKGLILRKNGDEEGAKALIEKALDSNPFLPELWLEAMGS